MLSGVALTAPAFAQGRLVGRVMDGDGQPVVAAIVSLSGKSKTGAVITNAQGYYTFVALPEGPYAVRVSKRGAQPSEQAVSLAANSTVLLNLRLRSDALPALAVNTSKPDAKPESKPDGKSAVKPKSPDRTRDVAAMTKTDPPKDAAKAEAARPDASKVEVAKPDTVKPTPSDWVKPEQAVVLASASIDAELKKQLDRAEATERLSKTAFEKSAEMTGDIYKYLQYPQAARNTATEVTVAARVFVDETGKVIKVDMIKKGGDLFNEEVYRVLSEDMRFAPAILDGDPASGVVTVLVTFTPN